MRLILHADDFGLRRGINQAVFDCADKGVLTSASLMANGGAAEDAVAGALARPFLGVGLHLNILRGRPLARPETVASLIDRAGGFLNHAAGLFVRALLGRVRENDVYAEYRRQLLFMIDRGLTPTHFDGEKHTHLLLPAATRAMARLGEEFGIRRVRIINESSLVSSLRRQGVAISGSLRQAVKLRILEYRSASALADLRGFVRPSRTFGVLTSGTARIGELIACLEAILRHPGDGVVEWMLHPSHAENGRDGNIAAEFGGSFLDDEKRRRELDFLLSESTAVILNKNRDRLVSYRDL